MHAKIIHKTHLQEKKQANNVWLYKFDDNTQFSHHEKTALLMV